MTTTEKRYRKHIGKFFYNFYKDICYIKDVVWKKDIFSNRGSWSYIIYNYQTKKESSATCYGFYRNFLSGEELQNVKLELL